jgi:succinate dehydrogenase / fumarate reductase, membrane anchor subunit
VSRSRVIHWYAQRITGALLLVLLVMHFWLVHYMAGPVRQGELTFEVIRERISNPWMQAINISFLLVALYHGLNGLRNIILDFGWVNRRAAQSFTALLVIVGLAWAYWGITAFANL